MQSLLRIMRSHPASRRLQRVVLVGLAVASSSSSVDDLGISSFGSEVSVEDPISLIGSTGSAAAP